jgi:hypothetical protein
MAFNEGSMASITSAMDVIPRTMAHGSHKEAILTLSMAFASPMVALRKPTMANVSLSEVPSSHAKSPIPRAKRPITPMLAFLTRSKAH